MILKITAGLANYVDTTCGIDTLHWRAVKGEGARPASFFMVI
jgi:hypothetical protein